MLIFFSLRISFCLKSSAFVNEIRRMTGKGSSRQERVERSRQVKITDKIDVNSGANLWPHNGDGVSGEVEPSLSSVMRLIESFQNESRTSIGTLQSTLDSYASCLTDVESSLQDIDGRVTELEAKYKALSKSNVTLVSKAEDLESRSKRSNLRVLGVPKNTEGPQPTSCMSEFFLSYWALIALPLLDIAHRSLAPKPKAGAPARLMIVKVHHFQVKQLILQLAREKAPLMFRGQQIRIFPDFTVDVAKQRAAFSSIKQKLRTAEVKYGLLFPAHLQLTLNGERHIFNTPGAAETFYQETIAPDRPTRPGPASPDLDA